VALKGGTLTVLGAPPGARASAASAQPLLQQLSQPEDVERMRRERLKQAGIE
jgi:hypothetical protein